MNYKYQTPQFPISFEDFKNASKVDLLVWNSTKLIKIINSSRKYMYNIKGSWAKSLESKKMLKLRYRFEEEAEKIGLDPREFTFGDSLA
tara:strand:+ start:625 stop:891 length:267 start_codon:yes stop_codon:yes gene_type:complete